MADLNVKVERIVSVEPHPNADRLDVARVLDWYCVVQKGSFTAGDLAVYIPIDSILPQALEEFIFGPDSKVKLSNHRVKTIRLRGAYSQGLLVELPTIAQYIEELTLVPTEADRLKEGYDLTLALGITKYEPPQKGATQFGVVRAQRYSNPNFHKYTSIQNAKNYPDVFKEGEMVVITEKIHGTNFRAGWVPYDANTWLKRIKKWLRMAPTYEFVYGSHNQQLDDWREAKNVYADAVRKYRLPDKLTTGEVIYGEIYGPGIQKGYDYGLPEGEKHLAVFDFQKDGKYLSVKEADFLTTAVGLSFVPVIYDGPFNKEHAKSLTIGNSVLAPSQKVREGVVVKPLIETNHPLLGRKILKLISDEYLMKDNSDFH